MSDNMKSIIQELTKAFNTGVSYMLPVVVVGGIFLAISLAGGVVNLVKMGWRLPIRFYKI